MLRAFAAKEEVRHRDVRSDRVERILYATTVTWLQKDDHFPLLLYGAHGTKKLELVADARGVAAHVQRSSIGLPERQASDDAPPDLIGEHLQHAQAARQVLDERHDLVEVLAPCPAAVLVDLDDADETEVPERKVDPRAREPACRHVRILRCGAIDRVMNVLAQVPADRVIKQHCKGVARHIGIRNLADFVRKANNDMDFEGVFRAAPARSLRFGGAAVAPLTPTDLSFAEAFSALKELRGVSWRSLQRTTREIDPTGTGLSAGHLCRLGQGLDLPSTAAISLIAQALDVEPQYFAEYRLAEARALLDERGRGLDAALAQWRRIECLLGSAPEVAFQHRRVRSSAA